MVEVGQPTGPGSSPVRSREAESYYFRFKLPTPTNPQGAGSDERGTYGQTERRGGTQDGPSLREQEGFRAVEVVVDVTRHQGGWESQPQGEGRQKATLSRRRLARRCQETGAQSGTEKVRAFGELQCHESGPLGSGRGGWKRARKSNALAAYFMSAPRYS